nr:PREDICTED: uncharacterized protein LOC106705338 [Latimeria chalumnae]|eukprot:XP_014349998.1 PREDICTED: uncharacterized protein LOC106705338 [Latimeria chalumnae]
MRGLRGNDERKDSCSVAHRFRQTDCGNKETIPRIPGGETRFKKSCVPGRTGSYITIPMATDSASQPRLSSCRRRWIISTTLIETLFFSGVVFGWHSLLPMLKSEGIYSLLCNQSEGALNQTATDQLLNLITGTPTTLTVTMDKNSQNLLNRIEMKENNRSNATFLGGPPPLAWPTCEKQEAMLNLGFTMGSFCLGFTLLPLQVVMEMAHLRRIRMIGRSGLYSSSTPSPNYGYQLSLILRHRPYFTLKAIFVPYPEDSLPGKPLYIVTRGGCSPDSMGALDQ